MSFHDIVLASTSGDVDKCSFTSWYPKFKKYSIKAEVVDLDDKALKFLITDGIRIPNWILKGQHESQLSDDEESNLSLLDWESLRGKLDKMPSEFDSDEDELDKFEVDMSEMNLNFLKDLDKEVNSKIANLGGEIFPKLNWSAPKDARWIAATKSLKCNSLGDILLLFKASDDIAFDLTRAFDHCRDKARRVLMPAIPNQLILKQWSNLEPSMEFRCFVINSNLVGICQRDADYYQFLKQEIEWLQPLIEDFFDSVIHSNFDLKNYTVDIYVTKAGRKVKILDFNPVSYTTHPLLFDWVELFERYGSISSQDSEDQDDIEISPEFRVITNHREASFARAQRLQSNAYPTDLNLDNPIAMNLVRALRD